MFYYFIIFVLFHYFCDLIDILAHQDNMSVKNIPLHVYKKTCDLQGVYVVFLFFLIQEIDCGYSSETPHLFCPLVSFFICLICLDNSTFLFFHFSPGLSLSFTCRRDFHSRV